MKVETTNELVLKAAEENPSSRAVLITLFPSVFEDKLVACEVNSIFFRSEYPNNIYSVQKRNGNEIVVLNITHSTVWAVKTKLSISDMADKNCQFITVGEFKRLTGYSDMSKFTFIPRGMNAMISKFSKELLSTLEECE